MVLLPLHIPLISAGYFGGVIGRMLEFLSLRIRRSDQGMTPSLSPGLRAQTVALHTRLMLLTGAFHRLAKLAREGKLRVYPDRACPAGSRETAGEQRAGAQQAGALYPRPEPASLFGPPPIVVHGATLPALPTRGFGWMLGFVPASYRDAVAGPLRNPEMVTLIQASPAVAGLLRSLCHGLGVTRPDGVFPAPCRRRPRAARLRPLGGEANSVRMDDNGGTGTGRAPPSREPGIVMSAQARDRWWAERRGGGRSPGNPTGADDVMDRPGAGRCAQR